MTVIENLLVGFRIMQFAAVDKDSGDNAQFVYKLEDPSQAFGLEGDGNLVLQKPELFDRERMEKVVVRVLAVECQPSVLDNKVRKMMRIARTSRNAVGEMVKDG